MELTPTFLVMAQIAISLAAFTTLAAVIANIGAVTNLKLQGLRLLCLLSTSLTLLTLSLVPILVSQLDVTTFSALKISALIAFSATALTSAFNINYMFKVKKEPEYKVLQEYVITVFAIIAFGSFIMCVLGDSPAFWYLAGLYGILGICFVLIFAIIFAFPVFDKLLRPDLIAKEKQ
jgi:hypothetical protein